MSVSRTVFVSTSQASSYLVIAQNYENNEANSEYCMVAYWTTVNSYCKNIIKLLL